MLRYAQAKNELGNVMIYLNSKANQNIHTHTGQAAKLSILMAKGITSVSEENDCNIDATTERSNLKGWVEKFQGAVKHGAAALAVIGASATAACAQDAPKPTLVANNNATTPGKVTPASNDADLFATPNEDASDLFALPKTNKPSLANAMATADDRAAEARAARVAAEGRADAAEGRADAVEEQVNAAKDAVQILKDLSQPKT